MNQPFSSYLQPRSEPGNDKPHAALVARQGSWVEATKGAYGREVPRSPLQSTESEFPEWDSKGAIQKKMAWGCDSQTGFTVGENKAFEGL